MPADWALSSAVPILMWMDDIRNCSYCGAVKLLEHGINEVEMVFKKAL